MTTEKLLENLREQLKNLQAAIHVIETTVDDEFHIHKKRAILKSVKKVRGYNFPQKNNFRPKKGKGAYNGTHWMQKPENKAKMMKMVRHMSKGKR